MISTTFEIPGKVYDSHKKVFGMVRKSFKLKMVANDGKYFYQWFIRDHTVTARYHRDDNDYLIKATVTYEGTGKGNLLKVIRELFDEYEVKV